MVLYSATNCSVKRRSKRAAPTFCPKRDLNHQTNPRQEPRAEVRREALPVNVPHTRPTLHQALFVREAQRRRGFRFIRCVPRRVLLLLEPGAACFEIDGIYQCCESEDDEQRCCCGKNAIPLIIYFTDYFVGRTYAGKWRRTHVFRGEDGC